MNRIRLQQIAQSVLVSVCLVSGCFAGEKRAGVSLADYLTRLGYVEVPLNRGESDRLNNRFFVTAEIHGKQHTFIVDTGWTFTALDEAVAPHLQTLGELGAELDNGPLGKLTNSDFVVIDKLTLGRAQFLNQPAQRRKFSMDFVQVGFKGILGEDFFLRNYCLIDCRGPSLFVRPNKPSEESVKALQASLRNSGYLSVPLNVGAGLTARATVNDAPVTFLVDTGSDFTVLDDAIAKRLNLSTAKWDKPFIHTAIREDITLRAVGMGKIGAHETRVTVLKSLGVGHHTWTNLPVCVTELGYWNPARSKQLQAVMDGFLGADFLTDNHALIDCAEGTLWLRPSQ